MTTIEEAVSWWQNAIEAFQMANFGLNVSVMGAANRAYYSAFYAMNAILAVQGVEYKKHQAVEAAVHRDFVRTGRWTKDIGQKYTALFKLRLLGDYGNLERVSLDEAKTAISFSWSILEAVSKERPDLFPLPDQKPQI